MKPLIIITMLAGILFASTRVYEIEPFQNCNGWTPRYPDNWVGQTFVATCDSFLWVDMFIGAPNHALQNNYYHIEIQTTPGNIPIARGNAPAGDSISYRYTRANLITERPELITKGKEYLLKVTHGNGDSINFYYNPNGNVYPYGEIYVPPPQAANGDLVARVEGITRIPQDLFGTEIGMSFSNSEEIASC
jgi:hypothetical protein